MLKDEYKVYEEKMKKSIESVANDFAAVRAGRANASVLNRIHVDYYGTPTPIQQIASVASPDPRSLVITPWDASALKAIEKAILAVDADPVEFVARHDEPDPRRVIRLVGQDQVAVRL